MSTDKPYSAQNLPPPPPGHVFANAQNLPSPPPGHVFASEDAAGEYGNTIIDPEFDPVTGQSKNPQQNLGSGDLGADIVGAAEVGTQLATGAAASAAGGLLGAGSLALDLFGGDDVDNSVWKSNTVIDKWTGSMTYSPKTRQGKKFGNAVASLGEKVDLMATDLAGHLSEGDPVADMFIRRHMLGIPPKSAATVMKTALVGGPEALGFRRPKLKVEKEAAYAKNLKKIADDLAIDLDSPDVRAELGDAAQRLSSNYKTERLQQMYDDLEQQKLAEKSRMDALWTEQRVLAENDPNMKITIAGDNFTVDASRYARDAYQPPVGSFKSLGLAIEESLITYDVLKDPNLAMARQFISEIRLFSKKHDGINDKDNVNVIQDASGNVMLDSTNKIVAGTLKAVDLQEVINLTKRATTQANSAKASRNDAPYIAIKTQLNNFLEDIYLQDLADGSPAAIAKWTESKAASRLYHSRWTDDTGPSKLLKKMMAEDKRGNPEALRKVITGMSFTGNSVQAVGVVRHLKTIFGKDSPQVKALRFEYNYDLLQDVLPDIGNENWSPNLKAFQARYKKHYNENRSLFNEMNEANVNGKVEQLLNLAKAIDQSGVGAGKAVARAAALDKFNNVVAVYLFGHDIAKAGMLVRMVRGTLNSVFGGAKHVATAGVGYAGGGHSKRILAQMLGYDLDSNLIKKGTFAYSSLLVDSINHEKLNKDAYGKTVGMPKFSPNRGAIAQ